MNISGWGMGMAQWYRNNTQALGKAGNSVSQLAQCHKAYHNVALPIGIRGRKAMGHVACKA